MTEQIEGYRLSPQQTQLYLGQRAGARPLLAQCVVRLTGALDEASLREAVGRSVARHAILRTRFVRPPAIKLPLQVISDEPSFDWLVLKPAELEQVAQTDDAQTGASSEPTERRLTLALLERERARPRDLEHDPALRATLVPLSAEQHLLVLTLPALCADTRTLSNLVAELATDYGASVRGEQFDAATAAEEAVQYLQFSEWQNELLADDNAAVGREFWRHQEASGTSAISLPFAASPAQEGDAETKEDETVGVAGDERARVHVKLDGGVAALSKALGCEEEVLLLSCWEVLVQRLVSGDALIATLHDGRKYDELHSALGHFARALPLRTSVRAGIALSELVREVGERVTEAAEWQEYYVAATTDAESGALAGAGIGFGYERREAAGEASGGRFEIIEQEVEGESSGVRLRCVRAGGELWAEVEYTASIYERSWMEEVGAEYASVVESAVRRGADAQVDKLAMLSASRQEQLLIELNATEKEYARDKGIHELIEEQVERTPESIAVVYAEQQITYRELNARANQLAHYLRRCCLEPESRAAIYMERSIEMVVALLGVLKAGAAYVPLDTMYPYERLSFMTADAGISVLLTQERMMSRLPDHQTRVIYVDSEWSAVALENEDNLTSNIVGPQSAAYVIYTSGSTGTPKGVVIPHRGLTNYLHWATEAYRVAEGEGTPVHSPLGFDLTVTSLFAPLLVGRSVVLVPEEEGIQGLIGALRSGRNYSLLKITPSHLDVLNQMLSNDELAGVAGALVIGGEALTAETVSLWRKHAPKTRLVNEYGPTETVVGCCVYEVAQDDSHTGPVPIGRPIANTQIYLLDENMLPVAAGVAGELYIGGDGLARGYHARPDLTAEKFVPHPHSRSGGERLYRTGDVARFRPDGEVEYLGRADQQVKVRGYRIELGEIETALREYEGVREAVVVAREDVIGDKRLVAYLVAATDSELSIADIRRRLHEQLPDYMMPAAIVTVMTLPLTPNGKIDRAALPAPGLSRAGMEEAYVEPRTALEGVIANIWAETIGVERVGVRDNFFELGGHSLLATQVISRIREEFDVELAVREMFEGMTVEEMAAAIESREGEAGRSEKIARVMREVEEMSEGELIEKLQRKTGINQNKATG